jgi:hypothetical protein
MNLDKPAKILFGGIFAGALIYGLGVANTSRLERRVHELQKACVAETEAEAKKQGTLSTLASIFSGKMICDPIELARSDSYTGISRTIGYSGTRSFAMELLAANLWYCHPASMLPTLVVVFPSATDS